MYTWAFESSTCYCHAASQKIAGISSFFQHKTSVVYFKRIAGCEWDDWREHRQTGWVRFIREETKSIRCQRAFGILPACSVRWERRRCLVFLAVYLQSEVPPFPSPPRSIECEAVLRLARAAQRRRGMAAYCRRGCWTKHSQWSSQGGRGRREGRRLGAWEQEWWETGRDKREAGEGRNAGSSRHSWGGWRGGPKTRTEDAITKREQGLGAWRRGEVWRRGEETEMGMTGTEQQQQFSRHDVFYWEPIGAKTTVCNST